MKYPRFLDSSDTDGILFPNGSRLNCLLYADDLVLISNSTKGLQNALTILSQFCEDWLLNVNAKKTKILIFQKKCRKSTYEKQHFFINGNKIEIVNNYTYLGINVSSNGNFRINKTNLMEKTRRSIFATRRYLDFSKLPIHLANKFLTRCFFPYLRTDLKYGGRMIKITLVPGKKISSKRHMFSFENNFLELISDAQMRPVEMNLVDFH